MTTIKLKLTPSQLRSVAHDRATCAQLINEGRCCEMLDLGLSVIDLHGLLVQIEKALIIPLPKCCACGSDALGCDQIGAHTGKQQRANKARIYRWRLKHKKQKGG